MCATSEGKLGDLDVDIFMGHYDGCISVGDLCYSRDNDAKKDGEPKRRKEVKKCLCCHTTEQLAELIMQLIDNSTEG